MISSGDTVYGKYHRNKYLVTVVAKLPLKVQDITNSPYASGECNEHTGSPHSKNEGNMLCAFMTRKHKNMHVSMRFLYLVLTFTSPHYIIMVKGLNSCTDQSL